MCYLKRTFQDCVPSFLERHIFTLQTDYHDIGLGVFNESSSRGRAPSSMSVGSFWLRFPAAYDGSFYYKGSAFSILDESPSWHSMRWSQSGTPWHFFFSLAGKYPEWNIVEEGLCPERVKTKNGFERSAYWIRKIPASSCRTTPRPDSLVLTTAEPPNASDATDHIEKFHWRRREPEVCSESFRSFRVKKSWEN